MVARSDGESQGTLCGTGSYRLALVGALCILAAPYLDGKQSTREIAVPSNLALGLVKPYKPIVLRSEDEFREILGRAQDICGEAGVFQLVGDMSGLVEFERSLQGFDFANECLILIPVTYGADFEARLNAPYVKSRKLTCRVSVVDPRIRLLDTQLVGHPAARTDCFGIAVSRKAVDEVEVWIQGKRVASLFVN